MTDLTETRAKRFRFLYRVWEKTKGDEVLPVDEDELARELALDQKEMRRIIQYLKGEGLLDKRFGGAVNITHWGVVQVENSLAHPEVSSVYFPPVANMNVFFGGQSGPIQIQQGTQSSKQKIESVSQPIDIERLDQLVKQIDRVLPELKLDQEKHEEVKRDIEILRAELKPKTKLRWEVVKFSLQSLLSFFLSIGANAATEPVINEMQRILAQLG